MHLSLCMLCLGMSVYMPIYVFMYTFFLSMSVSEDKNEQPHWLHSNSEEWSICNMYGYVRHTIIWTIMNKNVSSDVSYMVILQDNIKNTILNVSYVTNNEFALLVKLKKMPKYKQRNKTWLNNQLSITI